MQIRRTPQQVEGGNQSPQSKAMVAVQVGDEDMVQARELQAGFPKLELRPFATINHEKFVPHVEHLRGGDMPRGGQCRTASEDM